MNLLTELQLVTKLKCFSTARIIRCVAFWSCVGLVVAMFLDRDLPFELLNYQATPTQAGKTAMIEANVKRDLNKKCAIRYSRYLYDNRGFRFDLVAERQMSVSALDQLIKNDPAKLKILVPIPVGIISGKATLVTSAEYICNPVHKIFPIHYDMHMEIEILPS